MASTCAEPKPPLETSAARATMRSGDAGTGTAGIEAAGAAGAATEDWVGGEIAWGAEALNGDGVGSGAMRAAVAAPDAPEGEDAIVCCGENARGIAPDAIGDGLEARGVPRDSPRSSARTSSRGARRCA